MSWTMKILIADDNAMTRMLLTSTLTKLGHEVHAVADGRQALEAWQSGEFPFVISDWMMPDFDGLEFCRRIRASQREEYTYIVLLTSNSGKANHLEGMNAGADDFITKPIEKEALAARVRVAERILGLHARLRAANAHLERRVRERTVELRTALRGREEFFLQASHELHAPMNLILGFAELLQMDEITDEQAASVRQILVSGHSLLRMIDLLLSVADTSLDELSVDDTGRRARSLALFDHAS